MKNLTISNVAVPNSQIMNMLFNLFLILRDNMTNKKHRKYIQNNHIYSVKLNKMCFKGTYYSNNSF